MNKHLTTITLELFDVVVDGPPSAGSSVMALGPGGKLVEEVWKSTSHLHFYAWCPYPKVKAVTKARMLEQFKFKEE